MIPDRWLMLAVLFATRVALAYQFQTVASVGPLLVDALSIDFAVLGSLVGLYMLPGVVVALPGGLLGQRFGAKRIVIVGLALMVAGGVLTAVDSLAVVVIGRAVSGVGAVFLNVIMTKMVADWFVGREIVTAMAVFVASWPLGLAVALFTLPAIAHAWSWQPAMLVASGVALAGIVLMGALYRNPPSVQSVQAGGHAKLRIDLTRREWILVSIAGSIWGIYNAGYIVLVSFLPELFAVHGYSLTDASRIVSLLGWFLIPSVPLSGYVAERLRIPNLMMISGFGTVTVAAIALPLMKAPLIAFAVIVLTVGLPAGTIMALPAQALKPENRAAGMGVYYTFYYAVMALFPALAGKARDLSGSVAAGAWSCAVMMMLALIGLGLFRLRQRSAVDT
jgi:predicted MFS family arabinose efflux permease